MGSGHKNLLFAASALGMDWGCKAKHTVPVGPLTSHTDQTVRRYSGKEFAKFKVKFMAKRITIFQETRFSVG